MKPFLTSRRKLVDILILLVVNLIFYFLSFTAEFIILFSFGFIWNWVASQDLHLLFQNNKYRFSMIRLVTNLQLLIKKPFLKLPVWTQWLAGILPAGIFWSMVVYFNDSHMPWWATFLGSLVFELSLLEKNLWKKETVQ